MMAERLGTSFLASSMNTLLISHIKSCLPALNKRVQELQQQKSKELASYGQEDSSTGAEKGALLLGIVTQFAQDFGNIIEGKGQGLVSTTEIAGGARIHYIFSDIYSRAIEEISFLDGLTEQDIRTSIKNSAGYRSALFVPETAFESLVKRQIERLLRPSEQCVQLIFEELRRISLQCERRELQRFPALRSKLYETVGQFLTELNNPTLEMVRGLVQIEVAYINMKHPEFIGGEQAVRQIFMALEGDPANQPKGSSKKQQPPDKKQGGDKKGGLAAAADNFMGNFFGGNQTGAAPGTLKPVPAALKPSPTLTEREQREVDILKTLLRSYFLIVKKTIADSVPKTIMHFLVNQARASIQTTLVTRLYKDDLLNTLLEENQNLVKARAKCKEAQGLLSKAQLILTEVREFNV
jgi:dynamin 1-like protein